MKTPRWMARLGYRIARVPQWAWVSGAVTVCLVIYGLIFFVPKPSELSYTQETCVRQLLLNPDIQQSTSEDFLAIPRDVVRIGPASLWSTRLCFEPKTSPTPGVHSVAVAPLGGVIAAKQFRITVPDAPVAITSSLIGATIATVRPVTVKLSAADRLHTYSVTIGDATLPCPAEGAKLTCDVTLLQLEQGSTYPVTLQKSYKQQAPVNLAKGELTTHLPLNTTDISVADGHVAYDMPQEFTASFDKPLSSIDGTLVRVTGENATDDVPVTVAVRDKTATITAAEALPRQATFRLTLKQAIATDGSSLEAPLSRTFFTSGGPKVSTVSVGAGNVAANATITLTFDQPLHESVDPAKVIRTTGVESVVRKVSATQVSLKLTNAPDCAAFTIVTEKGVKSGSNNEVSAEPWSHTSRITCGTSWSIGNSVKGRPITAYSFGSGPVTLFTAGIHGSEPSATTTMQAWVEHLKVYAPSVIPAGKRVVIVPNTNPDGIAANSRNNANNVNLGRNFPTANWKADIETTNGLLVNGGGASPLSEPEAAALATLTRQLRPRVEISFHAQGRLVGANKFADSVAIGTMYATTVGYKTMFTNAEAVMGYAMTGEYEDWMGETMGIPAILIELPSPSGNYLQSQLPALKNMLAL